MNVTSRQDLERMREEGRRLISPPQVKIAVGTSRGGLATGGGQVYDAIVAEVSRRDLKYIVTRTGCLGYCQMEPLVEIHRPGMPRIIFHSVNTKMVPELIEAVAQNQFDKERVLCSRVVEGEGATQETRLPDYAEVPFFSKQVKVVLRNSGLVDPDSILEYIARGGYFPLQSVLAQMSAEEVIDRVTKSGLRGRGGAGFPTGVKWGFARRAPGDEKFIVCNADEGDPGAYMDRSILEGDPHAVLEGMIIGAYAIGASKGYIYIREEYPLAIEKFKGAVDAARQHGYLGRSIMGSDFHFDVHIAKGAGAFVCGEETSLIASVEGKTGEPRQRPPFPAQSGLWQRPTNINNVETWASVPRIISKGAEWFAGIGTDTSKGTKVFSLVGKVNNTGLVEVPMGLTLKEMVFDVGGGVFKGRKFKAVQTGGPSGGCIPEQLLHLPVDYEQLNQAGAIMGSGGMIVMDDRTCMVDVARYFLNFLSEESCGKCVACREGIERLLQILDNICAGRGQEGDIELLEDLAQAVKDFSLCALGGTAPNPVLTTLKYFRDEYEAHIRDHKCPARVCNALIEYSINEKNCNGCGACKRPCPADAITGEKKKLHTIDTAKCLKCGVCIETCKFDAVVVS